MRHVLYPTKLVQINIIIGDKPLKPDYQVITD